MTHALKGLAESIAQEPGLIWKIWTENAATHEAGGIYLFTDRASAEAYLLGSTFDGLLRVVDAAGNVLAFNHVDGRTLDPVIIIRPR